MSKTNPSREPVAAVTITLTAREAELVREAVAAEMTKWLAGAAEEMQPAVGNEDYIGVVDAAWKLRLAADLLAVLDGPLGLPFRQRHEAALAKLQQGAS